MLKKSDYNYIEKWVKKIKGIRKLGGKCTECGEDNIFVLEFHHINDDKEFGICRKKNYSWSVLEKEIDKCSLLCSNCHEKMHHKPSDIRKNLLKLKGTFECSRCGYDGSSLDFHHTEDNKTFSFGDVSGKKIRVPVEKILSELEKVIVICGNCHAIEHINKEKFDFFKDKIYEFLEKYKPRNPPANVKNVINMLKKGHSQAEIARKLNYAKSTICDVIKRYNKKNTTK